MNKHTKGKRGKPAGIDIKVGDVAISRLKRGGPRIRTVVSVELSRTGKAITYVTYQVTGERGVRTCDANAWRQYRDNQETVDG